MADAAASPTPDRDETLAAIDGAPGDDASRRDSRLLYEALKQRKDDLKGETALPEDRALSEKILAEARTRSAQISASRGGTGHPAQAVSAGIPAWLWLAWIVAIAAVVLAAVYLV